VTGPPGLENPPPLPQGLAPEPSPATEPPAADLPGQQDSTAHQVRVRGCSEALPDRAPSGDGRALDQAARAQIHREPRRRARGSK